MDYLVHIRLYNFCHVNTVINGGSSTLIKSKEGIEDKVSQRIFPHPFASVIVKGALSKDIFKDYAKNYQDPSKSSILFTRSRFSNSLCSSSNILARCLRIILRIIARNFEDPFRYLY